MERTFSKPVFLKFFRGLEDEYSGGSKEYQENALPIDVVIDTFRSQSDTHPVAVIMNRGEPDTGEAPRGNNDNIPVRKKSSATLQNGKRKHNKADDRRPTTSSKTQNRRVSSHAAIFSPAITSTPAPPGDNRGFKLSPSGESIKIKQNQVIFQSANVAVVRNGATGAPTEKQTTRDVSPTRSARHHAEETLRYMHQAWKDGHMCDLVIQLGEAEFPIHKVVLAAHSRQFHHALSRPGTPAVVEVQLDPTSSPDGLAHVINFLYTSNVDVTSANVGAVVSCALQLHVHRVVAACKNLLATYDVATVLPHLGVAEKHDFEDLRDAMRAFVRERFAEVAMSAAFLDATYERVTRLLADDELNVGSETDVYSAAVRWLDHNRQARMPQAAPLLRRVRFALIAADDLALKVERDAHVMAVPECREMVCRAYRYHALRAARNPRVRLSAPPPRRVCRSLLTTPPSGSDELLPTVQTRLSASQLAAIVTTPTTTTTVVPSAAARGRSGADARDAIAFADDPAKNGGRRAEIARLEKDGLESRSVDSARVEEREGWGGSNRVGSASVDSARIGTVNSDVINIMAARLAQLSCEAEQQEISCDSGVASDSSLGSSRPNSGNSVVIKLNRIKAVDSPLVMRE